MGVQLVAVFSNTFGVEFSKLSGLEKELEGGCPSLALFQVPGSLRRMVHFNETEAKGDMMRRQGVNDSGLAALVREANLSALYRDGEMSIQERLELERRSWCWSRQDWDPEDVPFYELETRFNLYLPKSATSF